MRATTVGDGQAEHDLIAPWRVPDGQFSGGEVASYIGCPTMPERDHEPAPQRGDRLGRGYDCFGIAQSFAQCPASRFGPPGAMFPLAVLSHDPPPPHPPDTITATSGK